MYSNRQESEPGIGSWDWNLKGDKSTYHALYPRAWTMYEGNMLLYIVSHSENIAEFCGMRLQF